MYIVVVNSGKPAGFEKLLQRLECPVNGNAEHDVVYLRTGDSYKDTLDGADLVILTGGPDVAPQLYDQTVWRKTTYTDIKRDYYELAIFRFATSKSIPVVGVCRGAQLVCVANNGSLLQHVSNHTTGHSVVAVSPVREELLAFDVTSTHHQMMLPYGTDYKVLGWCKTIAKEKEGFPKDYTKLDSTLVGKDLEVIYWPSTLSIGFQYHPENMAEGSPGQLYFLGTVDKIMSDLYNV